MASEFETIASQGVSNSPEQIAAHLKVTGGKIRTRFPPEPNGYLHIGHAKALYMNFRGAFEKLGAGPDRQYVFFRYDDTNPESEAQEYIDSIAEFVKWMGWTPSTTTYASDYFQELYDLAVKLIKKGKAYCCHQSKEDMAEAREIAKRRLEAISKNRQDPSIVDPKQLSPWRDRSIEENLRLFEEMKRGMWDEGTISLRMKMDMLSANPNMWDSVAYRIKFWPHPHAGDKWCIYPTYDYTHCINDALEHIDYSCCTLEFQTRRESYYWLLRELDLWQPNVYESARLEIEYAMLSKRKIQKLVQNGIVRGWDDPRLCTLAGLRRRGYTPEILNTFCKEIGITRVKSCIEVEKLENIARRLLGETTARAFAVLDPLRVTITNLDKDEIRKVELAPPSAVRELVLSPTIYIERSDFNETPEDSFFGLGPGREVLLKYAYNFTCKEVVRDKSGRVQELKGTIDRDMTRKCRGTLHWLGGKPGTAEVRLYSYLFTVGNLGAPEHKDVPWEDLLNHESEQVVKALVEPYVLEAPVWTTFQFERLGYFMVDQDSKGDNVVFNRVITLRDKQETKDNSRKEDQEKQLAAKLALKSVRPEEMFRSQTDLYSKFDEKGIPTHDAAGAPISKSASKKLTKEWDKQNLAFGGAKKDTSSNANRGGKQAREGEPKQSSASTEQVTDKTEATAEAPRKGAASGAKQDGGVKSKEAGSVTKRDAGSRKASEKQEAITSVSGTTTGAATSKEGVSAGKKESSRKNSEAQAQGSDSAPASSSSAVSIPTEAKKGDTKQKATGAGKKETARKASETTVQDASSEATSKEAGVRKASEKARIEGAPTRKPSEPAALAESSTEVEGAKKARSETKNEATPVASGSSGSTEVAKESSTEAKKPVATAPKTTAATSSTKANAPKTAAKKPVGKK